MTRTIPKSTFYAFNINLPKISLTYLRKNQEIRAPEVFLVGEDGTKIGVLTREEALTMAMDKEVDLVEVSPHASPPVCKLIDFGKFRYYQEKAERKKRAKQKKVEIKGIRLTLKIGKHDLEVKQKQTLRFLEEGHKIRIEMMLRGREKAHFDLAREIMENFLKDLGENICIEQPIIRQGGRLTTLVLKKR